MTKSKKEDKNNSPFPRGRLGGDDATASQKQLIHINAPTRDIKEELVQWATDSNDKISCNDLSFDQANEVMIKLGLQPHKKKASPHQGGQRGDGDWSAFNIKNTQHKYILSLLRQLGWTRWNNRHGEVADMAHFGMWLQSKRSPVQKPLARQTKAETTTIINALESMLGKEYGKR